MALRPLAAAFPDDATAATLASQWLDGALLVAPVLSENSTRKVYLPAGTWYRFNTSSVEQGPVWLEGKAGLEEIPCFAPPGAIIPHAPIVQSSVELPGGPLSVHVYSGADGEFKLVEDDGESDAYTEREQTRVTSFRWVDDMRTLSWKVERVAVSSPQMFTQMSVTLFTASGKRFESRVQVLGTGGSITLPAI